MTLTLTNLPYGYKGNNILNLGNNSIEYWLKNSYGVEGFTTNGENILTLFAQLTSNAGFNPYDAFDSYDQGLENNPMGNYLNAGTKNASVPYYKQKDNEYYTYTNRTTYATENSTNPNYTVQEGTYYFANAAAKTLYDQIKTGCTTGEGTLVYYQNPLGTTTWIKITANYSSYGGVDELVGDGPIDPKGTVTLDQKVTAFVGTADFTSATKINGAYDQEKLVALYKKLSGELQGLKEYTLTNTEINDVIKEINTLNGAGVIGNLETKITEGQNDLISVFMNQADRDFAFTSIFEPTDMAAAAAMNEATLRSKLFGTNYTNNPFYQYYVGLRTNDKLTFVDSINQAIPEFNTAKNPIIDIDPSFKVSDYSGIQAQDDKLGPADVLDKLYITQELKAYYKQYEEAKNRSKSLELSLTLALQNSAEFDFRKLLAEKVLALLDTEHKLEVSNESSIANIIKRGSSTGPSALKDGVSSHAPFDGFYGNINTKATPVTGNGCLVDPYEIVINGTTYVFGKDDNSNGNIDDVSEILGITDTMENPFQSLLQLDINKDGQISKEELISNGVVLKAVDDSGKFTNNNFDLSMINNIDLKKLKPLKDGNSVGTFEMTFLNGKTIKGSQTFEDQAYFNHLFGKLVDLRPYTGTTATNVKAGSTAKTTTATASKTATAAAANTQTTSDLTRSILLKQINSMYSALIIDDTSNIETILDNICWKQSTILTPAQKIRIIDGIDPLMPVYQIESEIKNSLKNLNN